MAIEKVVETGLKRTMLGRTQITASIYCSCGMEYEIKEFFSYPGYPRKGVSKVCSTICPKCKESGFLEHEVKNISGYEWEHTAHIQK